MQVLKNPHYNRDSKVKQIMFGLGMYREWMKIEFPKDYYTNLGTTRLRGRPRNRRQGEVTEDGRTVGGEG